MSGGLYGRGKAPARACLNLRDWPEQDRKLWLGALAPSDPFAEQGKTRAAYRPRSNHKIERSYGRWLTFLAMQGFLDCAGSPADRITPEVVHAYVRELDGLGNRKCSVLGRLQDLGEMAKVLASGRDWKFIARIAAKVRGRSEPESDKRARLVGSDQLLSLGLQLMDGSLEHSTPRQSAIVFRDGLIVALLALRPLRRGNFVRLTIGVDLLRAGSGWVIAIPASAAKTHARLEFDWPEPLVPALDTYLAMHRPLLLGLRSRWYKPAADRLWISAHGSPFTEMALYDTVAKRTKAAFGRSINPHLFRDAAATTMAVYDPDHVLLAAPLLGHRNSATTERFYNQAQSLHVHREFAGKIKNLRRHLGTETESN